jgi:hypothetical protein
MDAGETRMRERGAGERWKRRSSAPVAYAWCIVLKSGLQFAINIAGPAMSARHAACSCGKIHLTIEGEPARISMCHCLECQRRTGAVISNQARFRPDQVTIAGTATAWTRTAQSGSAVTFHFCPTCGSTVYWESESFPGYIIVAIGNFADPKFPAPTIAVWEESRHPWLSLPSDTPTRRMPQQG